MFGQLEWVGLRGELLGKNHLVGEKLGPGEVFLSPPGLLENPLVPEIGPPPAEIVPESEERAVKLVIVDHPLAVMDVDVYEYRAQNSFVFFVEQHDDHQE